ncbi:MAG: hypothetical protein QXK01_08875 [Thermofilum sp.]|uniref:hypothetical protein n=1 Tax=Thermofilum sp. TaxID=1961369 RepID=UPI0031648C83
MSNDKVVKVVKLREKPTRNSYKQYFIGIPIELVRKWERKKGRKPNQVMIEETEEGAVLRVV